MDIDAPRELCCEGKAHYLGAVMIGVEELGKAYEDALDFLAPFVTYKVCKEIARFDRTMDPDRPFDMLGYLRRSLLRYRKLFQRDLKPNAKWLEVGVLFPALPIALANLGFKVSVVEEFSFYPPEIIEMYNEVSKRYSLNVISKNIVSLEDGNPLERYDYVSLLGVIEHLPHTPRLLLENIHSCLVESGTFFLDVPNVYYIANILRFLRGQHLQPSIAALYDSAIPFVGHHREYKVSDLRYVLERSRFTIVRLETFNYSIDFSPRRLLKPTGFAALLSQMPPWREILFAECRKR